MLIVGKISTGSAKMMESNILGGSCSVGHDYASPRLRSGPTSKMFFGLSKHSVSQSMPVCLL
ncbi:unnamed protein product [Ixodes pacificus]